MNGMAMGKALRWLLAAGAGTTMALTVAAVPASAHDVSNCITSGGLCIASGNVYQNHTKVMACDHRGDDLGVRTWYITGKGGVDYVGDANGAKDGCGSESAFDGGSIERFQVCMGPIGDETCTSWKNS